MQETSSSMDGGGACGTKEYWNRLGGVCKAQASGWAGAFREAGACANSRYCATPPHLLGASSVALCAGTCRGSVGPVSGINPRRHAAASPRKRPTVRSPATCDAALGYQVSPRVPIHRRRSSGVLFLVEESAESVSSTSASKYRGSTHSVFPGGMARRLPHRQRHAHPTAWTAEPATLLLEVDARLRSLPS